MLGEVTGVSSLWPSGSRGFRVLGFRGLGFRVGDEERRVWYYSLQAVAYKDVCKLLE